MSKLSLLCLLVALFLGVTLADLCIPALPPLSKGQPCRKNAGFKCNIDTYCGEEGVCISRAEEGEDCEKVDCIFPYECRGPTGFRRCMGKAHPGQDCQVSASFSIPSCGTGYCDGTRCVGGFYGDACFEDGDCFSSTKCTLGICTGTPIGGFCSNSVQCTLGSKCDYDSATCKAILAIGGNCTVFDGCPSKSSCVQTSEDSTSKVCVAYESLEAGSYCGGVSYSCKSLRCLNNYCAESSPDYCTSDGYCALDERCACDGKMLDRGVGQCKAAPCFKLAIALNDCVNEHCGSSTSGYFNGSCTQVNCDKQYLRYEKCSPASTLLTSFFSIAFFALLSSFFSRHF